VAELKKTLGYGTIIALSITSVLGTGIYIGPAIAARYAGPASILSWILLCIIAVYVAACFGELAGMFPNAGGVYEYSKQTYGRFTSFMIGWTTWLVANIGTCLVIVAAMNYLNPLIQNFLKYILNESISAKAVSLVSEPLFSIVFAAVIIIILNYIAYRGIEASAALLIFFAVITLGVAIAVIVPGISHVELGNFSPLFAATPAMIFASLFFIMETFFGWESVTFLAEETKDAKKVIPLSLVLTTVLVCVITLGVAFVMLGTIPADRLANSPAPFDDISRIFFPDSLRWIVSLGIVVSLFGAAAGAIVSSPRLLLALARDKLFINQLGDVHPKYQTPYKAILFQAVITIIVVVIGFGSYDTVLRFLVPMALLMYITILLAVPILRFKLPDIERPFKVPFGKIGPIIVAFIYTMVIYEWLINPSAPGMPSSWQIFRIILSFIFFGVPIYLLLLFHYDPDIVVRLNDIFAYFSLFFEKMLVPKNIKRDIFNHLTELEGKRVLEFGCGVGTLTTELARRVGDGGMVYATDVSYTSVKIARKRVLKTGYQNSVYFIHDIHQVNRVHSEIPQVDCIVSLGMLGYIQDIKKVLNEMARILPEGGRVFFVDYIDLFKVIPNVSWLSHHEQLKDLFRECGFSVRVEKVSGSLWNYVFIYGIKSEDGVPFI
jgi:basic amino acid/polyamine antiporter, APA family